MTVYSLHQTVICLITAVDAISGKINLSLRVSETPLIKVPYLAEGDFVCSYFEEMAATSGGNGLYVSVGQMVMTKVKQVLSHGMITELDKELGGFVTIEQFKGVYFYYYYY